MIVWWSEALLMGVLCVCLVRRGACWVRDEALAGTCGSSASLSDGANGETRVVCSAVDIDALRRSNTWKQDAGCRTAMRVYAQAVFCSESSLFRELGVREMFNEAFNVGKEMRSEAFPRGVQV